MIVKIIQSLEGMCKNFSKILSNKLHPTSNWEDLMKKNVEGGNGLHINVCPFFPNIVLRFREIDFVK